MHRQWPVSSDALNLVTALAFALALLLPLSPGPGADGVAASELRAPKPGATRGGAQNVATATPTATTPTAKASATATATAPATATPTATAHLSDRLTATATHTPASTATATTAATPTGTATLTSTPTSAPTGTASPTVTATATGTIGTTGTPTPTGTPTGTPTPTDAPTATGTATGTATAIATATATGTASGTASATATAIATATATGSVTATPTGTPTTLTVTATGTPTATATAKPSGLANDDFDSATEIGSLPYIGGQTVANATVASDDPSMGAGAGVNSQTVWFRFVAPSSGTIRAHTLDSDYDTVLAAFRGSRGSLTWLAGNDDIGTVLQSEIVFRVQAGATYYLEVAEWGDDGTGGHLRLSVEIGDFRIETPIAAISTLGPWVWPVSTYSPVATSTPGPAPSNDDFGSATLVGALPYVDDTDTTGATSAPDDPDMGSDTGRNSNTVWYRFVVASDGSVRVATLGSDYDTVLAAFTGSRGALTLVTSNDDLSPSVQSEVHFNVQAGATYYLEVAQYGVVPGGGHLGLMVEFNTSVVAGTVTPVVTGTPGVLVAMPAPIPPAARVAQPVTRDSRYFAQTGFRVNLDPFWDYFQKRGGVRTFGYPISGEFALFGFEVQMFQRGILQLMPGGSVATMNLLDEGLMPYDRINFSIFPAPEKELIEAAPSPLDPKYGARAVAFLNANVPDRWEGMEVNLLNSFLSTVRYEDAFPDGDGQAELIPLLNLELWGLPTSQPAFDPTNGNFVYQRFQRGILMYDASTGVTQGLLLADYLKGIVTGQKLPADLEEQARGSRFYHQYDSRKPGYLARPAQLPGTNLEGAFESELARPPAVPAPTAVASPTASATPAVVATRTVTRSGSD